MRACKHIGELETILSGCVIQWNKWWEPHYEDKVAWWITCGGPSSEMLPLVMGDAVHNLRSALDILVCDLARISGTGFTDMKFPFAVSKKTWDEGFEKEPINRLRQDMRDAVKEMGAYRDGPSSGLRVIHDLDILDKHRLVVPVYAATWAEVDLPAEIRSQIPPDKISDGRVLISEPDFFLVQKGLEFSLLPKQVGSPIPHFPYGLPQCAVLGGQPVTEILRTAASVIENWVADFAAKFG